LVVIDWEQYNGWQQLHNSYVKGYSDTNSMGLVTPARIQVRMVDLNVASILTWWEISFRNSKKKVVGNTTALLSLRKAFRILQRSSFDSTGS
jgi:hypothetical protein